MVVCLETSQCSWLADHPPVAEGVPLRCQVRLRHRQPLQDCTISLHNGGVRLNFDAPQRAVTAGQSAVFYKRLKELGFHYVTLDLAGYRTGSMNEVLPKSAPKGSDPA